MGIWVRSQDKRTLINTRRIDIDDKNIIVWDEGKYASEIYLGNYKSKERALEVLDEIQDLLKPKYILDSKSIKPNRDTWEENGIIYQYYNSNATIEKLSTYVYEMPEE